MKLQWNKTVQSTVLAVLIVVMVPIAYIGLFAAGIINHIGELQTGQVVGYSTKKECEQKNGKTCELVTTDSSDQFWIVTN